MTDQPVPQRLLERLAAGALSDEESAQLLARLKEEPGGIERLEALIQENEAFLKDHPPQTYIPMIRARHEALQKKGSNAQGASSSGTGPFFRFKSGYALVAVAVVLALIVLSSLFVDRDLPEPPLLAEEAIAEAPEPDEITTLPAGATPDSEDEETRPRLPTLKSQTFVIGETRRFEADGVKRVLVDDETVVSVGLTRDQEMLVFRGLKEGESSVEIFFSDDRTHSFQIRVSEDVPEDFIPYDMALVVGETSDLNAHGIYQVYIDDDDIVTVDLDPDDNLMLQVRAKAVGTTLIHFHSEDRDRPHTFRFHVGEPLPTSDSDETVAQYRQELADCAPQGGTATVAALVDPEGAVVTTFAEEFSLSDQEKDCFLEAVAQWRFPPHNLGAQALARFEIDL